MKIERGIIAFFKGISLCLTVSNVRRLALLPWLFGLIAYPLALTAAYYSHEPIVHWFVSTPEGFVGALLYWLTWVGVTLLLFVVAIFASVLIVLVCTAAFQTAIVEQVLRHEHPQNAAFTEGTDASFSQTLRESVGAIFTESIKLLWILPLLIIAFILGLIPFLTPFAFILTSWLLAFQFIDIVLDVARFSATRRVRYTAKHWIAACSFGLVVTIFFLLPFAGIFLGPIATAGAAWMLAHEQELWEKQLPET